MSVACSHSTYIPGMAKIILCNYPNLAVKNVYEKGNGVKVREDKSKSRGKCRCDQNKCTISDKSKAIA